MMGSLLLSANTGLAESWDMAMAYSPDNYHTKIGVEFAKCVGSSSQSNLELKVHPAGELARGADIKKSVETGRIKIGERLLSAHVDENPIYGIDSIPFLATSFDQSEKLWQSAGDKIQTALAVQNLIYLYTVPWPPQGFYFNKEISKPGDLSGVKFRAYNDSTARLASLSDMESVRMPAINLLAALENKQVEAFMSSAATGYDREIWKFLKNFYDAKAWLPRNVVFANKDAWESLDVVSQAALFNCGSAATEEGLAIVKELSGFYKKGLETQGMQVEEPNEALQMKLNVIGQTMTEEWLAKAGKSGHSILNAYKKM